MNISFVLNIILFNMDLLAYKECRNEGAFKQLEK